MSERSAIGSFQPRLCRPWDGELLPSMSPPWPRHPGVRLQRGVQVEDRLTITAKPPAGRVRAHTKASASCGQCTPVVEAILAHCTGEAALPQRTPAFCTCTDLGHDAIREAIAARNLKTIPEIRAALGWKTADGRHKCRPALNYYLLCAWPGEYVDDQQSRFINERVHANIQKDGTYSVVPRLWGGITNPAELRAIADVAEKHKIPAVKLTGGQRIDLLGVRKEQLPAVWADLGRAGLVSGHAYGKAIRTVKTCVGSEWCRFGVQDSTGLGIKLEKMTWAAWAPHKFKMAVSGCPRNCAEATIKDFGVVCVEAATTWSSAVTAASPCVTDHLARVASESVRILRRLSPALPRGGIISSAPRRGSTGRDCRRQAPPQRGYRGRRASMPFLAAQAALQRDPGPSGRRTASTYEFRSCEGRLSHVQWIEIGGSRTSRLGAHG